MQKRIKAFLGEELRKLDHQKLYKNINIIESAQGPEIIVKGKKYLNFCTNNYLGFSSHPDIIKALHEVADNRGYGLSSVPFICGTQDIHKELEKKISGFLGMEDTILFSSCYDANHGVFEPLFGEEDAIITDALNHASIIDGIRSSKAQRWVYNHGDMRDAEDVDAATGKTGKGLERCLKEAKKCRFRIISTDGVFSMDGDIAKLNEICDLAEKYDAIVMVDDSHATGFIGKTGRGSHEYRNVMGRVDIITTTFGKALGGASGGCISSSKEIIEWMRNKARPFIFSNTVSPVVVGTTIKAFDLLTASTELRDRLEKNTKYFRAKMTDTGFDIIPADHPIVAIMFNKYPDSSKLAVDFASKLFEEGIYVIAFSFPIVPRGKDRIRVQISAAHSIEQIDRAVAAFSKVGKEFGLFK
jgi:glycine C-acetyltransferase